MFKSRRRKAEEEAKLEENYRPTKTLEADESNVSDDEKGWTKFPLSAIIIFSVIVVAIIICIILIICFGGPFDASNSN